MKTRTGRSLVSWSPVLTAALLMSLGPPSSAPAASHDMPSLSAAAAVAKAAVVTLKLPGRAVLYGVLVNDPPDIEEPYEEPRMPVHDADFIVGSAVIIEGSGIAVTTARLGRRALALRAVTSDGRRLSAMVIGRDDETDIAVLALCCDQRGFSAITLADSNRARTGDRILAIGAPFGLEVSVTASVITSVVRNEDERLGALIQTGPSVTSGYAGGPIVDTSGAMVGLVLGNNGGTGIVVPSNLLRTIISALLEDGRVRRASLGVKGQTLDGDLAEVFEAPRPGGVVIVDVRRDGPAARAGLLPGDIIYELNGRGVDSALRLGRVIGALVPGETVLVKVWRRPRDRTLELRLDEEPDPDAIGALRWRARALLGAEVDGITSEMGVVVSNVDPDGPAARAGIRRADVIREVNGHAIRILGDFDEALRQLPVESRVALLLQRGPLTFYVTLKP
jgi:serine protease Do